MLPIVVNPGTVKVGLAGAGEGTARRLALLRAAGIEPAEVDGDETPQGLSILFIAGLERAAAAELAAGARARGVLVNVEDAPELCDFHVPAIVRRGALMLTASTGGRSPGLARQLREWLERRFGAEWDGRLEALGAARRRWRAEGVAADGVAERTRRMIDGQGWLP